MTPSRGSPTNEPSPSRKRAPVKAAHAASRRSISAISGRPATPASSSTARRQADRHRLPGDRQPDRATYEAYGNTSSSIRRERPGRSEEHTSELQSRVDLVCRLLLEKKKINNFLFTLLTEIENIEPQD